MKTKFLPALALLTLLLAACGPLPSLTPPGPTPTIDPDGGPPVVLVHGFQGLPGANSQVCLDVPAAYPAPGHPLAGMADWFAERGYMVWLAAYETSSTGTPTLAENGGCLRNQLAQVYGLSGGRPLTVVAHSMGGLVSRAALHGADFEVAALVTLGTPHGGMPIDFLAKLPGFLCQVQAGACELALEAIPVFNAAHPNPDSTATWFIGGTHGSGLTSWWLDARVGANDGVVGAYSAIGLTYPAAADDPPGWRGDPAGLIWTDETHGSVFGAGFAYALPRTGGTVSSPVSDAFTCVAAILAGEALPPACSAAAPVPAAPGQQPQFTFVQQLSAGPVLGPDTADLTVDAAPGEQGRIIVLWDSGDPQIRLESRGGLDVTAPTIETVDGGGEFPSFAYYDIRGDMPDAWSLSVDSAGDSRVSVFAIVNSNRVLTAETERVTYRVSDAGIVVSAALTAAGRALPDGTVWAYLEKDTGSAVELVFDGAVYTGLVPVPQSPGVYLLTVAAAAQDGELFFNRQVDLVVIVLEE